MNIKKLPKFPKIPKFSQLLELIKSHKKQTIIISAIAVAVILLIIILLIAFLPAKAQKQSAKPKKEPTEAVTTTAVTTAKATTAATTVAPVSETPEPAPVEEAAEEPVEEEQDWEVPVQSGYEQATGYEPLDTLMNNILSGIVYQGMTSNAKLNAIYNYVKSNMQYDMFAPSVDGTYDTLISLGYSDYDSRQMSLAYDAATYYQGVCDHYAALTMILARAAGIPLFQSGGLSYNGSSHAWNILFVDGEKYLVDTNYGIFMQRFSDSGFTEQMDGSSYFNYFNTAAPAVEEKKISWMFNAGFEGQRFMGNDRGEIWQTATINRPMYATGALYPNPITPTIQAEGTYNTFSATVSANGAVIETLKEQSGDNQMYYFSWYPPNPGSYRIEITVHSDDVFTAHFYIDANITG